MTLPWLCLATGWEGEQSVQPDQAMRPASPDGAAEGNPSPPEDPLREPRRKGRWILPFLLFLLGVVPLYLLAGASALRSHLLTHGPVTPDDARAAWVFLGAWTAGVAGVISAAMAWSHNSRSLTLERQVQQKSAAFNRDVEERTRVQELQNQSRLILDTAVTGLGLLTTPSGTYAARSTVAGALATLVHLH